MSQESNTWPEKRRQDVFESQFSQLQSNMQSHYGSSQYQHNFLNNTHPVWATVIPNGHPGLASNNLELHDSVSFNEGIMEQQFQLGQDLFGDINNVRTPPHLIRSSSDLGVRLNFQNQQAFINNVNFMPSDVSSDIKDMAFTDVSGSPYLCSLDSPVNVDLDSYSLSSFSSVENKFIDGQSNFQCYMDTRCASTSPNKTANDITDKLSNFASSLGTFKPFDQPSLSDLPLNSIVNGKDNSSSVCSVALSAASEKVESKPTYSDILTKKNSSMTNNAETEQQIPVLSPVSKLDYSKSRLTGKNKNKSFSGNYIKNSVKTDSFTCSRENSDKSCHGSYKIPSKSNPGYFPNGTARSLNNSPSHSSKKCYSNTEKKIPYQNPSPIPGHSSEAGKNAADQLNNHVPSQQKQAPKKTSYIYNNLGTPSSTTSVNGDDVFEDEVPEDEEKPKASEKGSVKFESKKEHISEHPLTRKKSCEASSNNPSASSVQSSAGFMSRSTNSARHTKSSNYNRSDRYEKAKEPPGFKKSILRKRKTQFSNYHAFLLTTWACIIHWMNLVNSFVIWLAFIALDVIIMSSQLLCAFSVQSCGVASAQLLSFQSTFQTYWQKVVLYFTKQKKESSKNLNREHKFSTDLDNNISLPTTGEEAMKRLLACRGKDPYSILGVTRDCTDDDIKRYYKRQAFLVHPDKNKQPGAEEAFKILAHAFEIIGEPERRCAYDTQLAEEAQLGGTFGELASLLTKLQEKLEEAANTIRCTNCNNRHKRVKLPLPTYAARHCADCQIRHSAREGDIWAESSFFGLRWRYYACMDGAVYDITQWASCQSDNLKHLQANTHSVQYRIVSGKKTSSSKTNIPECPSDPDIEEFFNNLCREQLGHDYMTHNSQNMSHNASDMRKRKGKKKK